MRCNSGFFAEEFLTYFEERKLNYITAVKVFAPIKPVASPLGESEVGQHKKWVSLKDGIEITEWMYRLPGCPQDSDSRKKARRKLAVRKDIQKYPKSSGKLLLFDWEQTQHRYSVFVTNMDLSEFGSTGPAQQI